MYADCLLIQMRRLLKAGGHKMFKLRMPGGGIVYGMRVVVENIDTMRNEYAISDSYR